MSEKANASNLFGIFSGGGGKKDVDREENTKSNLVEGGGNAGEGGESEVMKIRKMFEKKDSIKMNNSSNDENSMKKENNENNTDKNENNKNNNSIIDTITGTLEKAKNEILGKVQTGKEEENKTAEPQEAHRNASQGEEQEKQEKKEEKETEENVMSPSPSPTSVSETRANGSDNKPDKLNSYVEEKQGELEKEEELLKHLSFVEKDEKTGEYKWPELILTPLPPVSMTPLQRMNSLFDTFAQKGQNLVQQTKIVGGKTAPQDKKANYFMQNGAAPTRASTISNQLSNQLSRGTSASSSKAIKLPVHSHSQSNLYSMPSVMSSFSDVDAPRHSRTTPTVQSVYDPVWMGRRAETAVHTHTKFNTKQFCKTPYGEGEVVKYKNDGTADVKLQWGAVVSCDVKDMKTTRVICTPNLEHLKPLLTPIVRKHHMNMLYSRYKLKGGKGPMELPLKKENANAKNGKAEEKKKESMKQRMEKLVQEIHSNYNNNKNNNKTDTPPQEKEEEKEKKEEQQEEKEDDGSFLSGLNFGETSYNTMEKLNTLEGSQNIPNVQQIQSTNFLPDRKGTFAMPCFARPCEIKTIESCVYVDRVEDFKLISDPAGCQPVYRQSSREISDIMKHSDDVITSAAYKRLASQNEKERKTSVSPVSLPPMEDSFSFSPSSMQYDKIATEDLVKAPAIVHSKNSLSSSTNRYISELSSLSRQLGWSADWRNAGNEEAKNMNLDEQGFLKWINNINDQFNKKVVNNNNTPNGDIYSHNNSINNHLLNTIYKSHNNSNNSSLLGGNSGAERKVGRVMREELDNIVYQ